MASHTPLILIRVPETAESAEDEVEVDLLPRSVWLSDFCSLSRRAGGPDRVINEKRKRTTTDEGNLSKKMGRIIGEAVTAKWALSINITAMGTSFQWRGAKGAAAVV